MLGFCLVSGSVRHQTQACVCPASTLPAELQPKLDFKTYSCMCVCKHVRVQACASFPPCRTGSLLFLLLAIPWRIVGPQASGRFSFLSRPFCYRNAGITDAYHCMWIFFKYIVYFYFHWCFSFISVCVCGRVVSEALELES